ncbi:helix-turn-helix transcriptional regulator [Flavitalea sp. BT771]|uniref:helix-turn-helix domain-containing protein n=1 Tax=Flavitalea sp. BT771 TaxID=3063329 RepID=UPI0026E30A95|nr:helix-turn-helix transcriptional regulator [Flavitalea sp. BT771]MDO6435667.1 helix-turn-helix transcriptional regulator [Flavitalea sp. BT771]MDV6224568.1 helix-turn-helix transcriptional regulator [Flavitalea sp. BT771]
MTQNILLVYCRRTMHYSPKKVAATIGIPVSVYREIESGEVLLTYEQARKMAVLYKTETHYFFESAQQLDLLLSSRIIIQTLKADNDRLQAELHKMNERSDIH